MDTFSIVQDKLNKEPTYVQLSQDRYAHLSEIENQLKQLTEQLSTAQSELSTKDALIKQHTKVAEEAVSGITYLTMHIHCTLFLES